MAERVEPWTYLKFPYLKGVGWNGFDGWHGQRRLLRHAALAAERLRWDGDAQSARSV